MILKPSEITPLTSLLLAEGLDECGLTDGVFAVATGGGATGAALLDEVDMIMFTGSTELSRGRPGDRQRHRRQDHPDRAGGRGRRHQGAGLSGLIAWLIWLFVHLWYLVGFQNRLLLFIQWFSSFATHGRGARLITEPAASAARGGQAGR